MVLREKPTRSRSQLLSGDLTVEFEPVHLPEATENERIKRLSRQILAVIERARRDRRRAKKQPEDPIFQKDFDEIFGLKELSV